MTGAIGSADLVTARIRRANPSIGKEAARQLAAEFDDIVACALKRWRAAPDFGVGDADAVFYEADGANLIQMMTYTVVDSLSASEVEALAAGKSVLRMTCTRTYSRFSRASVTTPATCICATCACPIGSTVRKRSASSSWTPVRRSPGWCSCGTTSRHSTRSCRRYSAVRLAQKGEGPRKIFDLLPAFKDSSGLDFIMEATEEHREALFDLLQDAGIPVV